MKNFMKKRLTFSSKTGKLIDNGKPQLSVEELASEYVKEQDKHRQSYKDFIAGYNACSKEYIDQYFEITNNFREREKNIEETKFDINSVTRKDGKIFIKGDEIEDKIILGFDIYNHPKIGFMIRAILNYSETASSFSKYHQDINEL